MLIIPNEVQTLIDTINKAGHSAYIVGGCVRDALMNKPPHDYDLCTSASPEKIKEIFNEYDTVDTDIITDEPVNEPVNDIVNHKYHTFDTGIKHGTVTVLGEDNAYEITTFRIDGKYTDGRHPDEVIFTDNITEDLSRRDFTINAMAYNDEEGLIDPFGGKADIDAKTIRCVGNPDNRFQEDALRILRALRFSATLGFSIEEKTKEALFRNKNLLKNIAQERKTSEFCKMLRFLNYEMLMEYREIFAEIIPEIKSTFDFDQHSKWHEYDIYSHTAHAVENAPCDLLVRLSVFFHDIAKPESFLIDEAGEGHFYGHAVLSEEKAKEIMARMRFDNKTIRNVAELIVNHDREIINSEKCARKILNELGPEQAKRLVEVELADKKAQRDLPENLQRIKEAEKFKITLEAEIEKANAFSLKDLAVNGNDMISLGYKGKDIGKILEKLLNAVIENPEKNNRKELINIAESITLEDGSPSM